VAFTACWRSTVSQIFGMLIMIEPLVMTPNDEADSYLVDGDADRIISLVRQAVESEAE